MNKNQFQNLQEYSNQQFVELLEDSNRKKYQKSINKRNKVGAKIDGAGGAIAGAALGGASAGPVGAVVGAAVGGGAMYGLSKGAGHLSKKAKLKKYDKKRMNENQFQNLQEYSNQQFVELLEKSENLQQAIESWLEKIADQVNQEP